MATSFYDGRPGLPFTLKATYTTLTELETVFNDAANTAVLPGEYAIVMTTDKLAANNGKVYRKIWDPENPGNTIAEQIGDLSGPAGDLSLITFGNYQTIKNMPGNTIGSWDISADWTEGGRALKYAVVSNYVNANGINTNIANDIKGVKSWIGLDIPLPYRGLLTGQRVYVDNTDESTIRQTLNNINNLDGYVVPIVSNINGTNHVFSYWTYDSVSSPKQWYDMELYPNNPFKKIYEQDTVLADDMILNLTTADTYDTYVFDMSLDGIKLENKFVPSNGRVVETAIEDGLIHVQMDINSNFGPWEDRTVSVEEITVVSGNVYENSDVEDDDPTKDYIIRTIINYVPEIHEGDDPPADNKTIKTTTVLNTTRYNVPRIAVSNIKYNRIYANSSNRYLSFQSGSYGDGVRSSINNNHDLFEKEYPITLHGIYGFHLYS